MTENNENAVVETTTEPKSNKGLKIAGTVAGVGALVMLGFAIARKIRAKKAAKAAAAEQQSQE